MLLFYTIKVLSQIMCCSASDVRVSVTYCFHLRGRRRSMVLLMLSCLRARHEGIMGSRGIPPHISNLDTRCRWVVNFTPLSIYQRQLMHWRLDGPRVSRDVSAEENNTLPRAGNHNTNPLSSNKQLSHYTKYTIRVPISPKRCYISNMVRRHVPEDGNHALRKCQL